MRWPRHIDPSGRQLVDECEAFLSGRLAEHLVERREPVPPWVWTNLLAHGTVEQLQSPSRVGSASTGNLEPWLQARAYVAGEVMDAAQRAGSLSRLQRTALAPLELTLSAECPAATMRPSDWVSIVLAAIQPTSAWQRERQRS